MISSQQVYSAAIDIVIDPAGAAFYPVLKAPKKITIVSRTIMAKKTQNAGTAVAIALHNYDTAGTAIKSGAAGTIGVVQGGTAVAARLTANVPATSTTFLNPVIGEGEYVVASLTEEGSGWESGDVIRYQVDYVYGIAGSNQ